MLTDRAALLLALAAAGTVIGTGVVLYDRITGRGRRMDELQAQLQAQLQRTEDYAEGSRAFLEKRPPRWRGS